MGHEHSALRAGAAGIRPGSVRCPAVPIARDITSGGFRVYISGLLEGGFFSGPAQAGSIRRNVVAIGRGAIWRGLELVVVRCCSRFLGRSCGRTGEVSRCPRCDRLPSQLPRRGRRCNRRVISAAPCRRAVVWISSTQAFISGLLLVAVFHVSSSSSMSPRVGRRVGSSISSVRQRRQPASVYGWSLAFGFCGVFGVVRVALQCGQRRGGQRRPVIA